MLGGALSPIDGVDPDDLRIAELVRRVEGGGVEEVILATNPTMTGEATASYVATCCATHTRVTRLASGLPVGGDLEFADEVTSAAPWPAGASCSAPAVAARGPKPSHDGLS